MLQIWCVPWGKLSTLSDAKDSESFVWRVWERIFIYTVTWLYVPSLHQNVPYSGRLLLLEQRLTYQLNSASDACHVHSVEVFCRAEACLLSSFNSPCACTQSEYTSLLRYIVLMVISLPSFLP